MRRAVRACQESSAARRTMSMMAAPFGASGPQGLQARVRRRIGDEMRSEQAFLLHDVAAQEGQSILILAAGRSDLLIGLVEAHRPECLRQSVGIDEHDTGGRSVTVCRLVRGG